jgi:hypothetical protein
MTNQSVNWSRYTLYVTALLGVFMGIFLTLLIGKIGISKDKKIVQPVFLKQGFDFNQLRSPSIEWRGPEIGEMLDLNQLRENNGNSLSKANSSDLVVLVNVSPNCGFSTIAADEMKTIREHLASLAIPYYAITFTDSEEKFIAYSSSLGFEKSFYWQPNTPKPKDSLIKMAIPSHLLVRKDGLIVRVWPGTNESKEVRERMGNQIISDTSIVKETLTATKLSK